MKILAIYFKAGSGISIFYERIIGELAKSCEVEVLCDKESDIEGVTRNYTLPFSKRENGWYRRLVRWFGITPISERWSRNALDIVAKDYDVVMAFVATSQLTPAVCGRVMAERLNCKFAVYTVDAIPAPGGWTRRRNEFLGKKRVVARNFSVADYVAASNPHMLEYQLSVFPNKSGLRSEVLLTPSPNRYYNCPPSDEVVLLYAGSIYGKRNPDHFFKAFKRLLTKYPQAQFVLVGMGQKLGNIKKILTEEERQHIVKERFADDLEPYFRRAKVLVDIDADLEKDPFLSSKIVTYLKVNRVILSETGKITPSREMFAGLNTVVQCDHNEESLYKGMLRAIELADSNPDFSEREPLIKEFSIEHTSQLLRTSLAQICNKE